MKYAMPKNIGDHNKNQMLSILRAKGKASRVDLSRMLGISATAITRNTSKLLESHAIQECGVEHSTMGRKPILMELCADYGYVIGADIVGGKIRVALADFRGNILHHMEEILNTNKGAQAVFRQLLKALNQMVAKAGIPKEKIQTIVVGSSGIFDEISGKSRFAFYLDGWEDINIKKEIESVVGIHTIVDNDVALDIVGECWKGIGKDYDSLLYVKLGQGLASRIVLDGKIFRGEHGLAGEIGYMMPLYETGEGPNYEHRLCNHYIVEQYLKKSSNTSKNPNNLHDLFLLREKGDIVATEIIQKVIKEFSLVLLGGVTVIDPQVIILGGDASFFTQQDIDIMQSFLKKNFPSTRDILPSTLRGKACVYGAVKVGLEWADEQLLKQL